MTQFNRFVYHFFSVLWAARMVILGLFALIIIGAWIISKVEGLSFGDSCYFSFVTGLTVGYGDIVAKTITGRVVALFIGWIGIIFTGINVAAAVRAAKEVYKTDTKTTNNSQEEE
jgi:voltage-gated potassium channel